jgi:outer membrane protein TolC
MMLIAGLMWVSVSGETITLETTLSRLLNETTRGRIIAGQHQVAQERYNAERIGYYIPEISFNTTLPSYQYNQDYDTYPGFTVPLFFGRSYVSGSGDIRLKHKIVSGGDITFMAAFNASDREYPFPYARMVIDENTNDTTFVPELLTATDRRRGSNFTLQFNQPIFQPSESRSAYLVARDNLSQADIEWRVNLAELKKEGITAYFELMTADLDKQIAENQSRLADFNAKWDSVKYQDSVITEEAWIESKSTRLEKRLALFDAEASYEEKKNEYNHLLDFASEKEMMLQIPMIPRKLDETQKQRFLDGIDKYAETELAYIKMQAAERELGRVRSSMGLNGNLNASYSIGRGNVKQSQPFTEFKDVIRTKDWHVSLDLTYPIWDGGASQANAQSQELAYESARLEYLAAERNARNRMEILLKRVDINHAKLSLLDQELDLAEKKLQDAEERHEIGMISDGTLLENRVYYFEARKNQLMTLMNYYLDLMELEKTKLP